MDYKEAWEGLKSYLLSQKASLEAYQKIGDKYREGIAWGYVHVAENLMLEIEKELSSEE